MLSIIVFLFMMSKALIRLVLQFYTGMIEVSLSYRFYCAKSIYIDFAQ